MAVQYARAMGLNVAAVDIDDSKLDLATRLGATLTVNAHSEDPSAALKKAIGGAHGALVTAVSPKAFQQALGMVRRGGTVALNGLPRSEEHTSELQSLMRISYAVFCLKKNKKQHKEIIKQ